MTHLVVLLSGWDWIQLANVHKIVDKHGAGAVQVTTLDPGRVASALGSLKDGDKIHVVGHGRPGTFAANAGTDPAGLASLIHEHLPANTKVKIRVDTCYSGTDGDQGSTAKIIRNQLVEECKRSADQISVSGTLGPSVTGVLGQKRIVVNPDKVDEAGKMQSGLMNKHAQNITRANASVKVVALGSSDDEIKTQASRVHGETGAFFTEFAEQLNRTEGMTITHADAAHKVTIDA